MQVTKKTGYGHHTLVFNINETATNVSNNTSTVSWSVQLTPDASWDFYDIGSTIIVTIDGQQVYNQYAQRNCDGYNTVTWASGTTTINHNSDGSKTASFSVEYSQASILPYTPGNTSLSGNIVLTNIPRSTKCPNLTGYVEDTYNIKLEPAVSTFTHSLKVTFGSLTGYINASGNLQSTEYKFSNNINFTIPGSFYAQIPSNAQSAKGTLTLTTYNGSMQIGATTGTLTANCSEDRCKPNVQGVVRDINLNTYELTGNETILIAGYSNAGIIFSTLTASKTSLDTNSTITSRVLNNQVFNGNQAIIYNVQTGVFNVTITNSRGFITNYTINASKLIPYTIPQLEMIAERYPDQTSSTVRMTYSGSYFYGSFGSKTNSITMKWYWKLSSSTSWTLGGTVTPSVTTGTINKTTLNLNGTYPYTSAYDFKLEIVDLLNKGIGSQTATIVKGIPIYSHGEDWFQHHTDVYDKNDNKILSPLDLFPIGAVYITVTNTNPGTFLGGTWTQFGQGRTLVGVNTSDTDFATVEKTGGEKTHKLTINEMPSHTHGNGYSDSNWKANSNSSASQQYLIDIYDSKQTTSTGGDQAHNNLQPYITVYFWKRTA